MASHKEKLKNHEHIKHIVVCDYLKNWNYVQWMGNGGLGIELFQTNIIEELLEKLSFMIGKHICPII